MPEAIVLKQNWVKISSNVIALQSHIDQVHHWSLTFPHSFSEASLLQVDSLNRCLAKQCVCFGHPTFQLRLPANRLGQRMILATVLLHSDLERNGLRRQPLDL